MKPETKITQLSARKIAAKALNKFESVKKRDIDGDDVSIYAADVLKNLLPQTEQKPRATDLVYGTIRNRTAIDLVLGSVADTPAGRIAPKLVNIVRLGVYELVYRPETPEYSIINDAVENAKSIAAAKQAGFVNAVLRKIASRINNRDELISPENARLVLPGNNGTGCRFDRTLLADPKANPVLYYSCAYSLPSWLIKEWLEEFDIEKLKQICVASNRRSSVYLRPNANKINSYHLAEILTAGKVKNEITPDEKMLKLIRPGSITKIPGFDKGLFTVQNLSAASAVNAMEPKAGWKILDLCSAPGTKTTQLAELTEDKAKIFATDIDSARLEKVKQNAQRLGLSGIEVFEYSQLAEIAKQQGPFDAVLIDVPCSNTGVLAKRPEVRLRIKQKSVENLMLKQAELLKTAMDLVKQGGIICYSTCSILKSENQQQVQNFISENSNLQLVTEELILPSAEEFDHDGGYYAIIKKMS